jgi:hypothetical protein
VDSLSKIKKYADITNENTFIDEFPNNDSVVKITSYKTLHLSNVKLFNALDEYVKSFVSLKHKKISVGVYYKISKNNEITLYFVFDDSETKLRRVCVSDSES